MYNKIVIGAGVSAALCVVGVPLGAQAAERAVSDVAGLRAAIAAAQPGDEIVLAAGVYRIDGDISCSRSGTAASPITVRPAQPGAAKLEFNATEGFKVSGAHWIFRDLEIEGVCATDSACEHAFHLFGDADGVVIAHNKVYNYNAHIKSNGIGDPRTYPDDVLVLGNEFYSEAPRQTSNPVTPIDVVGGRRWRVEANYIHDFAKAQGNNISYAAFLKGNSKDGVFARNLIVCEVLHTGNARLGLSFGGGGTSPDSICEDGTCTPEHEGGIMRNNIIANCPSDVGIYLNNAKDVKIFHNTLYRTTGIDVRFMASVAELRGNITDGRIRTRDGGTMVEQGNRTQISAADWGAWFEGASALDLRLKPGAPPRDAGMTLAQLPDDFCGKPRDARPDEGAVEGDGCDTARVHPTPMGNPADMGMLDMGEPLDMGGARDMGQVGEDMPGGVDMAAGQDMDDADMAAGEDMSGSVADMAGAGDMSAPQPGGTGKIGEEDGCAVSGVGQGSAPGWGALLAAVLVTAWRRRRVAA